MNTVFEVYAADEEEDFTPIFAPSMTLAMLHAEADHGPIVWTTPVETYRGAYLTGRVVESQRGLAITRHTLRNAYPNPLPAHERVWQVRTSAHRERLGTITRAPYVGDTAYVYSAACLHGDWENSSKAWDEVGAQRALSDHHHSKHGLAREDY